MADGDLEQAAELLGSPVHLRGLVRRPLGDPQFALDGALVQFPPTAALPPRRSYRCRSDGETAVLTLGPPLGRADGAAGWLRGPAVETGPGVEIALDLDAGGAPDLPGLEPATAPCC